MKENINWRLYGFTPYNISEIQSGIQFGHAAIEYGLDYFNDEEYQEWAKNHKTFIILNGGTSFTMNEILSVLKEKGIKVGVFREPDLNNMTSGIVFLVDSRVYDRETYPDFYDYCLKIKGRRDLPTIKSENEMRDFISAVKEINPPDYQEWLKFIGGDKNIFLRDYLKNFKLR